MRPKVQFLTETLIRQIIAEAITLLGELGVDIENERVLSLLAEHGALVERRTQRVRFPEPLIRQALATVPTTFQLYDVLGTQTHDFRDFQVHFTPGSSALDILDPESGKIRRPQTADYIAYTRLVSQLPHIAAQSTAFVPADVPENIADSYRLYLSLLYGEKPVVTGTFSATGFAWMKEMLLAVRGTEVALKEKPLAIFSCCPISPLQWGEVTSQNLLDCAQFGIPVELIPMPMAGFIAPVTLTGTLIQHTAENLSGVVIAQLAQPGTPMLYGGSPSIFDIRYETAPMGAIETMMIDCAYNEIGKYLGLPTQAYIALSDAKQLDAQAGLESGMGATLATLAGINNVSGPGMMDFENCFSLEKLVVDHEICAMSHRLAAGIEPRDDFPALPLFQELLQEQHLLIANHTRRHLRTEQHFPGPVINRAGRARWLEEGGGTVVDRARAEVTRRQQQYEPSRLPSSAKEALTQLMSRAAAAAGMARLPEQI